MKFGIIIFIIFEVIFYITSTKAGKVERIDSLMKSINKIINKNKKLDSHKLSCKIIDFLIDNGHDIDTRKILEDKTILKIIYKEEIGNENGSYKRVDKCTCGQPQIKRITDDTNVHIEYDREGVSKHYSSS